MEKIKQLSIELLKASDNKDIDKCLQLLEEIAKVIETYKRSC